MSDRQCHVRHRQRDLHRQAREERTVGRRRVEGVERDGMERRAGPREDGLVLRLERRARLAPGDPATGGEHRPPVRSRAPADRDRDAVTGPLGLHLVDRQPGTVLRQGRELDRAIRDQGVQRVAFQPEPVGRDVRQDRIADHGPTRAVEQAVLQDVVEQRLVGRADAQRAPGCRRVPFRRRAGGAILEQPDRRGPVRQVVQAAPEGLVEGDHLARATRWPGPASSRATRAGPRPTGKIGLTASIPAVSGIGGRTRVGSGTGTAASRRRV